MIVRTALGVAALAVATLPPLPAEAWFHAGGGSWSASNWRGSASGGGGSWSASNRWGGTASGGGGSWSASGARGSASGGDGSWSATNRYGTTASGQYHGGYYGAYHPPVVVNHYGAGCYNCGGWSAGGAAVAAGAVGVAAGAAIGAAGASAASANAYAAGVAAGAAAPVYAVGGVYPTLPGGCQATPTPSGTFYACGSTWFSPAYGANGVYYRVVPAP
jgi:hypothetical protein